MTPELLRLRDAREYVAFCEKWPLAEIEERRLAWTEWHAAVKAFNEAKPSERKEAA